MAYSYTPTYYSTLHESITSMCKNLLPFSFKKRRLPAIAAAEKLLSKQQSDNLKWQQEAFHQIHNLMGLCKEGILHQDEVSAFRTHLLETLIASPVDYEPPVILRDKLIFLQELLYANCITEDEYHASKRPLLQRLAVQGAEIGDRDVIVAGPQKKIANEEWCVVDLKEDKDKSMVVNSKEVSVSKKIKGASSMFAFVSPDKYGKLKEDKDASNSGIKNARNELMSSTENPFWNGCLSEKESGCKSVFVMESLPEAPPPAMAAKKGERKPFRAIFQREQNEEHVDPVVDNNKEKGKVVKRTWGFDGFKKWKKSKSGDEIAPLSLGEKSDDASHTNKNLQSSASPSELLVDEAFGENVKKELCRIQTELIARSPHVNSSDDQIEEISSHIGERERRNSKGWTTFDDEENTHPNLFAVQEEPSSYSVKQARFSSSRTMRTSINNSSIDKGFKYNPFFDV